MKTTWKKQKLTDIASFFEDGNWIESKDQSPKGYWLIQTGNVGVVTFRDKELKRFVSEETFKRLKCTEIFEGDILISRLPDPVGRACIVPKTQYKMLTAVDCSILRVKPDYDIRFVNYLINANGTKSQVYKLVTGSSRKRISRKNLGTVELPIPFKDGKPDIVEQKRIADNLDRVFVNTQNASSLLQQEKASGLSLWYSLANKTFSNPNLTKQQIGKSCDLLTGGTPSRYVPEYWNGDIRWMASGDINKQFVHEVAGRITKLGMESSNAKLLPIKSVLVALNGQGKTRGMVAITEVELTCNQSLAAIVPKKGSNIDPDYLFWNLYSRYKEIRYLRGGEFRSGLNLSLIRQLDFPVPMKDGKPDLAEQKRIAKELGSAFAMSQRLITLFERQELHLTHLRAAALNKIFGTQAEESKESVGNPTQTTTTPRLFDVQQAIAHIVKRFQRGEMVVAKLLYIGQAIYGVPTNLHFTAQNFGPYDSTVKKAVVAGLSAKNDFFAKRGAGQTQVLTLGANANRVLRYSTSDVAQKTNEYLDEMMPYFYQYDSASIELLATLCKVIEDEGTANDATVKAKLQQWKPNKFADQDVSRTLAFIKKREWDKRLIKK